MTYDGDFPMGCTAQAISAGAARADPRESGERYEREGGRGLSGRAAPTGEGT
jgi:hypothetical protein